MGREKERAGRGWSVTVINSPPPILVRPRKIFLSTREIAPARALGRETEEKRKKKDREREREIAEGVMVIVAARSTRKRTYRLEGQEGEEGERSAVER